MKKHRSSVFREPTAAETLVVMAFGWSEERISIGAIVDMLAERGFGLLILLLALPTCLPIAPPGLSAIAGFPIAVIALQMVGGLPRPWLPKRILARTIATEDLRKVVRGGLPVIGRMEKVLKPRLPLLTGPMAERMVGILIALLGLMLASPIPFTNIPISFAILFLALGLIEQDGLMTSIGIIGGIAALGFLAYMSVLSWDALSGWLGGAI
ncbi:exopolysaccharide biosynthesis protein [Zavarzinia sp.]|uniref:exopolysaccharide biosynthesis protein n=1 Tax=Zavarzinia sp. TaxID=2027920 RepID=UPI003BB80D0E